MKNNPITHLHRKVGTWLALVTGSLSAAGVKITTQWISRCPWWQLSSPVELGPDTDCKHSLPTQLLLMAPCPQETTVLLAWHSHEPTATFLILTAFLGSTGRQLIFITTSLSLSLTEARNRRWKLTLLIPPRNTPASPPSQDSECHWREMTGTSTKWFASVTDPVRRSLY